MKDYYKILGVGETATNEQIKKAFKDIAKKEHPDRGGNEAVFKEANEAHDTLKDSQKRHDYDSMRKFGGSRQGGQGQHPFFNEDIFGDFFSGFSGGDMDFNGRFNFQGNPNMRTKTFRSRPQANRNIQVRMSISINDAMMNNEKTINY
jgi:curved DNA-binding protein